MYINSLHLKKLSAFKLAGIKELTWDSIEDINTIVGRNGHGKSSLITKLLPQCLPKPDFFSGGKYTLELIHKGDTYKLISNFSAKDKPHKLIKNGENLNIGGASKIQQELLIKEFGLTPDIFKLLTMEIRLSDMKGATRKNYLSSISPNNVSLALEKYKKVVTKIKSCKSILLNLYERKRALEDQLINDTLFIEILHNKEVLSRKNELLISWQHTLSAHISKLQKHITSDIQPLDVPSIRTETRSIHGRSHEYTDIRRTHVDEDMSNLYAEEKSLKYEIESLEEQLIETNKELDKYLNIQATTKDDGTLKENLTKKIKEQENHISQLPKFDENFRPMSEEEIHYAKNKINRLYELFNSIVGYNDLMSHDELNKLHEKVELYSTRLKVLDAEIDNTNETIDKLSEELQKEDVLYIPNCNLTDTCDAYNKYYKSIADKRVTRDELVKASEKQQKRKEKLNNKFDELMGTYSNHSHYRNKYDEIFQICIHEANGLNSVLKKYTQEDFSSRPLHVFEDIKNYIYQCEQYQDYLRAKTELEYLREQLLKIADRGSIPSNLLKEIIEEKRNKKKQLRNTHNEKVTHHKNIQNKYKLYLGYKEDLKRLDVVSKLIERHKQNQIFKYSLEYYQKLYNVISDMVTKNNIRLTELDNSIKEQEHIQYTIEKEIKVNIKEMEELQPKYEKLEMALSPISGFPHILTINFLNKIISNANVFIDRVFSYPFKIKTLNAKEKFNYNFKVQIGNVSVPEISSCSRAQKTMIDLAFNLATIIQLKLTDYPVLLDEIDKEFDDYHRQELIGLFKYIIENKIVSQLFMVSHSQIMTGLDGNIYSLGYDNEAFDIENPENFKMIKY